MSEENLKEKIEGYKLECFEGPLELLLHLIQSQELEVFDLVLEKLTAQLLQKMEVSEEFIDEGAEAMWLIASLAHLKSRKLLPVSEENDISLEEGDLRLKIMTHLMEYQRYKNAATFLEKREIDQSSFFCRKIASTTCDKKRSSGLEEVKLSELLDLFSEMMATAKLRQGGLKERGGTLNLKDSWLVSDRKIWLESELKTLHQIPLFTLFAANKSQEELISLFLALLELMKNQILLITKEEETIFVKCI